MDLLWHCVSGLLRFPMRGWYLASKSGWPTIPHPLDEPRSEISETDSDSVLLIGDGPAIGFGVASHDLALPGHLARQIARVTGRATTVYCVADPGLMMHNIEQRFADRAMQTHQVVIVLVGISDAVRLTNRRAWRSQLHSFIQRLNRDCSSTPRVVLVAIPPISMLPLVGGWPVRVAQRHALALNRELESTAKDYSNVSFLPFVPSPESSPRHYRSSQTYGMWASLISPTVARLLSRRQVLSAPDPAP